MNDNSKCFVFENSSYTEITYRELKRRREINPAYSNRKFLLFHGMLMEVPEKEYRSYLKYLRHHQYLESIAAEFPKIPFHDIFSQKNNMHFSGEESIGDASENVEETAIQRIMIHKLLKGLQTLSREEQDLIQALYVDGMSEREWSKISCTPQKIINEKRRRILLKLKKFMENQK